MSTSQVQQKQSNEPLLSNGKKQPQVTTTEKPTPSRRRRLDAFIRNAGLKQALFSWRARRHQPEKPKVVITRDRWTALFRCWVHVVPACGTIVLAYLNLHGFYIGADLEAWHSGNSNSLKMLMFQGTAKIFELLVVASLTTMILDVMRQELMANGTGLPLGYLFAHVEFASPIFFISPEFLSGRRGFGSWWKGLPIMFALLLCGGIALLVGPASALLLIPTQRDGWPAGQVDFRLAGNTSSLWPEDMTASVINSKCANPDTALVQSQRMDFSGCAWAGYQTFLADYREEHQQRVANISVTDGVVNRVIQRSFGQESTAIAPCAACGSFSEDIGLRWISAIKNIRGVSSEAHFQRFAYIPPSISVSGYVPVVRTSCVMTSLPLVSNTTWPYRFMPRSGPTAEKPNDLYYLLPARPLINTTSITMQWREIPQGVSPLSNGKSADYYPSAFLDVQVPQNRSMSSNKSYLYTCSVDARWSRIDTKGSRFDDQDPDFSKYFTWASPMVPDWPNAAETRPADRAIGMTPEWLQNLMPQLNNTGDEPPGWNTLTSVLDAERLADGHVEQVPLLTHTQSIISTLFVDGLSRHGYQENGADVGLADLHPQVFDRYNLPNDPEFFNLSFFSTVYKSGASLPVPQGWNDDNSTQVRWSVTLSGYSYLADDVSYKLSLTLLFIHLILAIMHTIWVMRRGTSSEAWASVSELLVLAQNSPPDHDGLGNTCAGIDESSTLRRTAHIRVVNPNTVGNSTGCEQIQLMFGPGAVQRTRRIDTDVAYGENPLALTS